MSYAEIRGYSQIYSLQDVYNSAMDHYVSQRFEMFAFLTRLSLHDKPDATEFDAAKRAIAEQIVTGQGLLELVRSLDPIYGKVARAG
jgi:hypothetical protein